jgi:L-lactate dehydrogenase (cytochrome)
MPLEALLSMVARPMPNATRINNVADARRLARLSLPRAVFDYIDGGAEDEFTMGENERAFREIAFRPRMALKVDRPNLGTTVLGTPVELPVLLAPCGLVRLMHPDGALGAARAAKRAGTVSVLSTVAGTPPEDLAREPGPRWFQLYAAGRDVADHLMGRAVAAGFEGLVVTVDTPALGKRDRDLRNGVDGPLALNARTVMRLGPQILARPRWSLRMLSSGMQLFGRAPGTPVTAPVADQATTGTAQPEKSEISGAAPVGAASSASTVAMLASPFSWDDVAWIRSRWSGPLLVKGVLSGEDAVLAAEAGADAVVVSNHGGRQLEGAPATARVLPEVVDAAGDRLEILVDGGVRRGGDVVKALAIGARAVLVGRPYLYSLAAAGESGVDRMLHIFKNEMTRTMSLLGCPSVADLDRSWMQRT